MGVLTVREVCACALRVSLVILLLADVALRCAIHAACAFAFCFLAHSSLFLQGFTSQQIDKRVDEVLQALGWRLLAADKIT